MENWEKANSFGISAPPSSRQTCVMQLSGDPKNPGAEAPGLVLPVFHHLCFPAEHPRPGTDSLDFLFLPLTAASQEAGITSGSWFANPCGLTRAHRAPSPCQPQHVFSPYQLSGQRTGHPTTSSPPNSTLFFSLSLALYTLCLNLS